MTYGRVCIVDHKRGVHGTVVSHSAELVKGDFFAKKEGPLIRPSGTFSPRGEGVSRASRTHDRISFSACA